MADDWKAIRQVHVIERARLRDELRNVEQMIATCDEVIAEEEAAAERKP